MRCGITRYFLIFGMFQFADQIFFTSLNMILYVRIKIMHDILNHILCMTPKIILVETNQTTETHKGRKSHYEASQL